MIDYHKILNEIIDAYYENEWPEYFEDDVCKIFEREGITKGYKAEPEKHGYWKWNRQYGTECSECGTAMFEVIGHIFSSATPKYCPYCGAKMDKEDL